MTREALDSAYAPSAAQIAAARAAGFVAWFGYFKFGNDGVLNGWTDDDFRRVLAGGLQTMAYCSGWASPTAARDRGDALGIRICLDDESGMRPDGSWVQAWLDASGAGLYGNYWVHTGRRAPLHVLAAYPTSGDPAGISWWTVTPRPASLCAWQWVGSHPAFGLTVDSTWLDDNFFASGSASGTLEADLTPQESTTLQEIYTMLRVGTTQDGTSTFLRDTVLNGLVDLKKEIAAIQPGAPVDLSGLSASLATLIAKVDVAAGNVAAVKAKLDKDLA